MNKDPSAHFIKYLIVLKRAVQIGWHVDFFDIEYLLPKTGLYIQLVENSIGKVLIIPFPESGFSE